MDKEAEDLTRIQPSITPMDSDNATRIQPAKAVRKRSPQPDSYEAMDAPTRLAIASANRTKKLTTLQPGTLIKERFQLVKELGRGGMGVVYTARDLVQETVGEENSLVAIKLLSDDFKEHPDALRMLQQETKKARGLSHQNIITVYDFDRTGDAVYMTMELMSGRPLDLYLDEKRHSTTPLAEVMPIITGIAAGLKYAHEHNIVHSDLKPANIFLTDNGPKILDFGIARAIMQSDVEAINYKKREITPTSGQQGSQTTEGDELFALTPSYASLEMFMGEAPNPSDDIYAFACICYQLLVGKHPYQRRSANDAYEAGMVPERIKWLKDTQWKALLRGLSLTRESRAANVDEFLDGLLPKKREPWKLISLAFAFVAIVSTGYFITRPPEIVEPSLFDNPPPTTEISSQLQKQLDDILEVAEVHMMVGRLLSPPGSNAHTEYQKVLTLHPYNRQAIAGLEVLLNQLAELATQAIAEGNFEQAKKFVVEGLDIYSGHTALQALEQQLNQLAQE